MADNRPTLDELRRHIATIESGSGPARRATELKAKTSGLIRRKPLRRKNPLPVKNKATGS
jgi:hypothetical protein